MTALASKSAAAEGKKPSTGAMFTQFQNLRNAMGHEVTSTALPDESPDSQEEPAPVTAAVEPRDAGDAASFGDEAGSTGGDPDTSSSDPAPSTRSLQDQSVYEKHALALEYAGHTKAEIEAMTDAKVVRLGTRAVEKSDNYRLRNEVEALRKGDSTEEDQDKAQATQGLDLDKLVAPLSDMLGDEEAGVIKDLFSKVTDHYEARLAASADNAASNTAGQNIAMQQLSRLQGEFPELETDPDLTGRVLKNAIMLQQQGGHGDAKAVFTKAAMLEELHPFAQGGKPKVPSNAILKSQPRIPDTKGAKKILTVKQWERAYYHERQTKGKSQADARKVVGPRPTE
jgi:hypothetical protein